MNKVGAISHETSTFVDFPWILFSIFLLDIHWNLYRVAIHIYRIAIYYDFPMISTIMIFPNSNSNCYRSWFSHDILNIHCFYLHLWSATCIDDGLQQRILADHVPMQSGCVYWVRYIYIGILILGILNISIYAIYIMILCNDQIGLLCPSGIDSIDSTILNKDHMIVKWTYTMGLSWNGQEPTWFKRLCLMGLHNTQPLDLVVPLDLVYKGLKKRSLSIWWFNITIDLTVIDNHIGDNTIVFTMITWYNICCIYCI